MKVSKIFSSAIEGFDSQKLMKLPQQKLRKWCFSVMSCSVQPVANLI